MIITYHYDINDINIPSVCAECGGKCCQIYTPQSKGGSFPDGYYWFEDWLDGWDDAFRECGAYDYLPPQFDPFTAHLNTPEGRSYKASVEAKGINTEYCPYWSKKGCILPRNKRPKVCREYACKRLKQAHLTALAVI